MPISFEQPGPGRVYNSNQQALSEQYAAQTQQNTQLALANASRMQQDRQAANGAMQQRDQFAAQNAYSPRDQGQAQAQMALQAQHGQIQSQLQQEDFSHGDDVRLSQLNQAKASIVQQQADGQISIPERDQMLTQLYTGDRGINVLKNRQEATQAKLQDQHIQQIKQQMQLQAEDSESKGKLEEQRLAYSAAALTGKLSQVPDAGEMTKRVAEYQRQFPDMPPADIAKHARDELITEGKYSTWYPDKSGVPTLAKDSPHGMTGAAARGGDSGEGDEGGKKGKGGAPQFDPSHAWGEAEKSVGESIKAGEAVGDRNAEVQKRYDARQAAHDRYFGDKAAARQAGKPMPFNPHDPKAGTDDQKAKVVDLQADQSNLRNLGLPPDRQFRASQIMSEIIKITGNHSDEKGMLNNAKPIVKDRVEKLKNELKAIVGSSPAAAGPPMTKEQRYADLERQAAAAKAASEEVKNLPQPAGPAPDTRTPYRKFMQGDLVNRDNAVGKFKGGMRSLWNGDLITTKDLKNLVGGY